MILAFTLTFAWAMRLSFYIGMRHKGEDYRYKEMREDWEKHGMLGYYVISFFVVYMLQALFSVITNSSNLFIAIFSKDDDIAWTDFLGTTVFVAGFLIEVIADAQLASFLARPKRPGQGKFLKSGLWRYSRHPNYFGEAVIWFGIFIIACGLEYGWITVYAPIFITLCLRFLSGVPFPEKKYKDHPEWQQYCRETNVFVPWFATVEAESSTNEQQ